MTTRPVEHSAVLVEPTSYMHHLRKGDEMVDIDVIGCQGPNLVCRGPEELQFEDALDNPVSDKRFPDQDPSTLSSESQITSLGILRDRHRRRTRYKPHVHITLKVNATMGICATSSVTKEVHRPAGSLMTLT